jgi:mannosyltransferase
MQMTVFLDGIIFSLQRHGGISVYFRSLLAHLTAKGIPVGVGLESPTKQDITSMSTRLGLISRESRLLERYRLCRITKDYSLFHSSYYRQPSYRNIPTVVTVHDFTYERFQRGPRLWAHTFQKHSAIRKAQALICISESTRDDLLAWVGVRPEQLVHVIPNGVSETYRPIPTRPLPQRFILFVGERREYKNFSLVVAALHHLPHFYLHCVGGGQLLDEEFSRFSSSVRDRVRHLGFLSDEELNVVYNQAVCLVYPSRYEGFGIPVVEAMRAGCPVVSLNCRAVVEVGGDALERLDEEDPRALAEAVQRLCEPAHRAQRVLAGLQRSKIYDWSRCHDQTLSVYKSLSS